MICDDRYRLTRSSKRGSRTSVSKFRCSVADVAKENDLSLRKWFEREEVVLILTELVNLEKSAKLVERSLLSLLAKILLGSG